MNETTLTFPAQFIQELANYLQKRPWAEANPFLVQIDQAARAQQQQDQEPAKTNGRNRIKEKVGK